jgi:hypothetical protein
MRRNLAILAALSVCMLLVPAAGAAAKAAPPKTCTTSSKNVVGKTVNGTLTASNVDPSQAKWATCGQAKKAIDGITSLRIEEPKNVAGYHCVPTVKSTAPDVVAYKCTFKGADTATFIKLTFQVKYDQD